MSSVTLILSVDAGQTATQNKEGRGTVAEENLLPSSIPSLLCIWTR